jgi:hypothetical protein
MRKTPPLVSESDYCVALGQWFSARGYECYPELEADLTVYHRARNELIAIEAKKDLNFKVLDQALQKKRRGHHDAVLICVGPGSIGRFWAPRVCGHVDVGIGVVMVSNVLGYDAVFGGPTIEVIHPAHRGVARHRHRDTLLGLMCPEAQVYATPGASGPLGFTSFRMLEVRLYREALKGPLSIPEARGIAGKTIAEKRLLEYFTGGAFKALEIKAGHIMIRGTWGSREVGHSGITWAPGDPTLEALGSPVLAPPEAVPGTTITVSAVTA